MRKSSPKDSQPPPPALETPTERFERVVTERDSAYYVLRLFVTGMTPRSMEAIAAIKSICEERLKDRYELDVVDLYQHPDAARGEQIIAAPTLLKKLPLPLRRLIGNLSDRERVLLALNLLPRV